MAQIDPAQAKRTNFILWATLLAAQGVYVVVTLSGTAKVRDEPLEIPAFPIVLAGVAIVTALGANFCWRRATGADRPLHAPELEPGRAFTFSLLAWVLDESIAVYGLVLGLLAFSVGVWGPFSLAAFVLMLLHRPT